MKKLFTLWLFTSLVFQIFAFGDSLSKEYNIVIKPYTYKYNDELINGYKYFDTATGEEAKIVVNKGDKLVINIKNETDYKVTNVHWHGLRVPNVEDGPKTVIKKGEKYKYEFIVKDSGTYWYHSHTRPVRDQVDEGMYSSLIVLDPNEKYSQDILFILDDIGGGRNQTSMKSMNHSDNMEIIGKIKTINGVQSENLDSVKLKKGKKTTIRVKAAPVSKVTYKTSNKKVATVNSKGVVTAKKKGTAKITVKCNGITRTFKVTVK